MNREALKNDDCGALAHCGYHVEEDTLGGAYRFSLTTFIAGARITADLEPADDSRHNWRCGIAVRNARGIGWMFSGYCLNISRYAAKSMARSMALELRRMYHHRSEKISKRVKARAAAAARTEETGGLR